MRDRAENRVQDRDKVQDGGQGRGKRTGKRKEDRDEDRGQEEEEKRDKNEFFCPESHPTPVSAEETYTSVCHALTSYPPQWSNKYVLKAGLSFYY